MLADAGEEFGPCNSGGVVGPGLVVPCRLTPALGAVADEVLEALEVARDVAVGERDAHAWAPIFIGHVRFASCGDVNLENTHPFTRRVNGSDFVFAHNGTLDKSRLATHGSAGFPAEGSTDSELAMCVLLSWMARERFDNGDYALVEQFLRELNDAGKLNLLFSDGKRLYCYHDTGGYNGLCWTHREAPFLPSLPSRRRLEG